MELTRLSAVAEAAAAAFVGKGAMDRLRRMADNRSVTGAYSALREAGFVWIRSALATPAVAFAKSRELIQACAASNGQDALSVVGDFILPPPDGEETRDFQTLHFDFGIPLVPLRDQDVARYTALFIPLSAVGVTAVTRLVPLDALLGQRRWPPIGRRFSRT